jgi:hypothetical protein
VIQFAGIDGKVTAAVTLPTAPVTEPTAPVTEPTAPVTEPTAPVTLPTLPVRFPVKVDVKLVVTVVAAFVPAMKRPLAAPGMTPDVYRLLPMELAAVKSPAVASCQTPSQSEPVSWFVTVVTVPTATPSSTTLLWLMHSSDTPHETADATLDADFTVIAAAFATGIGG